MASTKRDNNINKQINEIKDNVKIGSKYIKTPERQIAMKISETKIIASLTAL